MLQGAGALARAGIRARVGAMEGAVGAAMLEPLIYAGAQTANADYDLNDTLANIAFGSVFGGGLHVIGGAVGDRIRAPAIEAQRRADAEFRANEIVATREAEIRESVAQQRARVEVSEEQRMSDITRTVHGLAPENMAGRDVGRLIDTIDTAARRVEEIEGRLASGISRATLTSEERIALAAKGDVESQVPDLKGISETPAVKRAVEIAQTPPFLRTQEDRIFLKAMKEGYEPKLLNERVGDIERQIERIEATAETGLDAQKAALTRERDSALGRMRELGFDPMSASAVNARISGDTRIAATSIAVAQAVSGREIQVDGTIRLDPASRQSPPTADELRAEAMANHKTVRGSEPDASREADEIIAKQRGMELDDLEAEIKDLDVIVKKYQGAEKQTTLFSKMDSDSTDRLIESQSRRNFIIGTAAALVSTRADAGSLVVGKAKPIAPEIIASKVSSDVEKLLVGNGATNQDGAKALKQAIGQIAKTGPTELRALAGEIEKLLPDRGVNLTVDKVGLWNAHGAVTLGPTLHLQLFTAEGRTGLSHGTVLHEALHVAVAARYRALSSGAVRANDALLNMRAPEAAKAMEQLRNLREEFRVASIHDRNSGTLPKDINDSLKAAIGSLDEFFVRALTDANLQRYMASKEYKGETLFERFKEWVKSSLFGFIRSGTAPSWLDAALAATNDMTTAMLRDQADFKVLRAVNSLESKRSEHFESSMLSQRVEGDSFAMQMKAIESDIAKAEAQNKALIAGAACGVI